MRKEDAALFTIGAAGYTALELIWRGRTHWTMAITGGACLVGMGRVNSLLQEKPLAVRALASAGLILSSELAVGLLVNRRLKWKVWDYSKLRGNVCGQICPQYAALWYLISLATLPVLTKAQGNTHD